MTKKQPVDTFPLGNKENLDDLNVILDDLYIQYEQDKKIFKLMFRNLPYSIYLKIDKLRSMSTENKNDKFKEVAIKAKDLSNKFHQQFK